MITGPERSAQASHRSSAVLLKLCIGPLLFCEKFLGRTDGLRFLLQFSGIFADLLDSRSCAPWSIRIASCNLHIAGGIVYNLLSDFGSCCNSCRTLQIRWKREVALTDLLDLLSVISILQTANIESVTLSVRDSRKPWFSGLAGTGDSTGIVCDFRKPVFGGLAGIGDSTGIVCDSQKPMFGGLAGTGDQTGIVCDSRTTFSDFAGILCATSEKRCSVVPPASGKAVLPARPVNRKSADPRHMRPSCFALARFWLPSNYKFRSFTLIINL
jgi:hypothetical protein